jgi:hypothetical protein
MMSALSRYGGSIHRQLLAGEPDWAVVSRPHELALSRSRRSGQRAAAITIQLRG